MIALNDNLPLVQFGSGRVVAFQKEWLRRSVRHAASRAGYPDWWLAGHVAESVATYLQLEFDGTVLDMDRLAKAVQAVLQVIGYAEIAPHFTPAPPPFSLSLIELAREAGAGYELAFFELLRRRLGELLHDEVSQIHLRDLQACVKHLQSAKNWRRDCAALRDEIVSFVRSHATAETSAREVAFTLF